MWLDLSEWQKDIDFEKLSKVKGLEGLILRVQAGYSHPDQKYEEYVQGCRDYHIPFGTYAYFKGVSIPDSIAEAKSAAALTDEESKFFALDIETNSMKDLVSGGQAFVDYMKHAGFKKVGVYSGENFFVQHGLDKINADFVWLANYGANDGQPHNKPICDLWQYTSVGKVDGISTNVDMSIVSELPGRKTADYFTGVQYVDIQTGGLTTPMLLEMATYLSKANAYSVCDGVKIGHYAEGSPPLADLENFLKSKGWVYTKASGIIK